MSVCILFSVGWLHVLLNVTVTVFAMSFCTNLFSNALACVITN